MTKIESNTHVTTTMTKLVFSCGSEIREACAMAAKLALERKEQVGFEFNGQTYHAYPERLVDAVIRTAT